MSRHVCDLLEALAHLVAPPCQAARPHVAFALRVSAGFALQLSYQLWLAACAVESEPAPASPPRQSRPVDSRINVVRGGSC